MSDGTRVLVDAERIVVERLVLVDAGLARFIAERSPADQASLLERVSPDSRLLAYAVDTNGSERFVLKVRDLETGVELPDVIENWRYSLVWEADSRSFLYTDADENWRWKIVWHHRLGDPQSADRAVYREPDKRNSACRSVARNRGPSLSFRPATTPPTRYVC